MGSLKTEIDWLHFAALLNSKLCHDLISAVGGASNGLELLEELGPEAEILNLITEATNSAKDKIQFYRIAYGAASSYLSFLPTQTMINLSTNYLALFDIEAHFKADLEQYELSVAKIIYNVFLLVKTTLPRGGKILIQLEDERKVNMSVFGEKLVDSPLLAAVCDNKITQIDLDNQTIVGYHLWYLLLKEMANISYEITSDQLKLQLSFN